MSEIVVNAQYLSNLSASLRNIADHLRGLGMSGGFETALCSSPEVWEAFNDFNERWDQRRNNLANSLDDVAAGFDTTRESFRQVEADLVESIMGDQSG